MKSVFRNVVGVISVLSCCTFVQAAGPIHFSSKAKFSQELDMQDGKEVVLRFTCQGLEVVRKWSETNVLTLDIEGESSIHGYWGTPEDAGVRELAPEELKFSASRTGAVVTLTSPERSFMHHSLDVDKLRLTVPDAMPVKVECLKSQDL